MSANLSNRVLSMKFMKPVVQAQPDVQSQKSGTIWNVQHISFDEFETKCRPIQKTVSYMDYLSPEDKLIFPRRSFQGFNIDLEKAQQERISPSTDIVQEEVLEDEEKFKKFNRFQSASKRKNPETSKQKKKKRK